MCFDWECSLVDCSSLNTGNMSVQLTLKLPTGETVVVPCSMPSIVVVPSLTSAEMEPVVSQSPATIVSATPVGLMTGLVSGQPSVPVHFQVPPSSPAVVASGSVVGSNSQPEAAFDLPESGLTALGIAASTREVGTMLLVGWQEEPPASKKT